MTEWQRNAKLLATNLCAEPPLVGDLHSYEPSLWSSNVPNLIVVQTCALWYTASALHHTEFLGRTGSRKLAQVHDCTWATIIRWYINHDAEKVKWIRWYLDVLARQKQMWQLRCYLDFLCICCLYNRLHKLQPPIS